MRPSTARGILALTRTEFTLALRRGENLLVMIVIPVALLVFFASLGLVPVTDRAPLDYLVPGILALAIMSTGMVNLGIATAYERYYGVLKRLGGSPLPRWGLLLAKALAVLSIEVVQIVALFGVAILGYGWQPRLEIGLTGLGLLLGTIAFTAIGLAMAGTLRAEATLALANGIYLLFLLLGDVVMPIDHLPRALQPVSAVLPATGLSDTLRGGLNGDAAFPVSGVAVLAAWAVLATLFAARKFRWD
jgi:ABC-2 type transport system permease protein